MKLLYHMVAVSLLILVSACKEDEKTDPGMQVQTVEKPRKEVYKSRNANFKSDIRFFTFDENLHYRETTEVPLTPGLSYGWILRAKADTLVHWKEELILPKNPALWDSKPAETNVQVTESTDMPDRSSIKNKSYGLIGNFWSVLEGDPEGIYLFKIFINGELKREFSIRFYKSPDDKPETPGKLEADL